MQAVVMQSTADNYAAVAERLRDMGLEPVMADTPRHALSIIESNGCIHLVVADALMPREGGFQLLKALKENPRFQWYPVAMTSSSWDHTTVRQSLESGADAILALPVVPDVFHAKIAGLLADGRRVVLVVDDEETIRTYMQTILEVERYLVMTVPSSEEALEFVKSHTVHAVISDIMMPGMNGLDLMVEIKKAHDHIPVILVTGFSGKFSVDRAIAAGADGYFKKPFKNTEMISTLRRVVRSARGDRTPILRA